LCYKHNIWVSGYNLDNLDIQLWIKFHHIFLLQDNMPPRSKAQKEHLAAMRALRFQEGGSGPSVSTHETLARKTLELQTARAAQESAEIALEQTEEQLLAEQDHSKDLYHALRMERQKATRTKAAKAISEANTAEAQSSLEELEDQFQQLTLKNEQLELTITELVDKWAGEKKIAQETLQDCQRKVKALVAKSRDASGNTADQQKKEGLEFSLMTKGVYSDEARQLCRLLVSAGCSQELVGSVVEEILTTAGVSVVGPTMSGRTVARSVLEGGVMADIQIGHEISKTSGLTVSGDGTTHKNVGYESRHVNMLVPMYGSGGTSTVQHKSRLLCVDSATDHSSQTQADDLQRKIQEKLTVYNNSPLAKRSHSAMRLVDFFARLQGMNSDHAKDQKKLAALLREIKHALMQESLGEDRLVEMSIQEMLALFSKANHEKIASAGGLLGWNALSEADQSKADREMMSTVVLKLGREAYSQLPEDEKHKLDFFIWAGCAMHKDLNCVKGGNVEMTAWWEANTVSGPCLLANKDNAAVLEQAEDEDEYTVAEQRAHDISSGGGVKLASLAGMIFNNKNDKVGQQDVYQQFFQSRGVKKSKFPDTSNTRYQSHCTAAAELLTSLPLYIDFMVWIKDGKDKPGFTNMERNVYLGLQDIPTQTELAVLALYAQAISHPYLRQVRGPGTEHVNMLDLAPLHSRVQEHMETVINNPSVLLPPDGSYVHGAMDGKPWTNQEAVYEIYKMSSSLPHLQFVLVAFFKGALATWKRFTSEFEEGGLIDLATAKEREQAWMPPTNDVNEGALGALRSYLRKNPNSTMHQYNALAMFKFNDTAKFVHQEFMPEDHAYVRQEARMKDSSHLERERQAAVIAYKDKQVVQRKEKTALKVQQKNQEQTRLAEIERLEDAELVTIDMTVTQLKDQLEIYRGLVTDIPLKSHMKTKADMIPALKEAIMKYKEIQS
jgi:hypothetical protein